VAIAIEQEQVAEPRRRLCRCGEPVLVIEVGGEPITASVFEWEPRSRCDRCAFTRAAHPHSHVSCPRCNDTGYVGTRRPTGKMLAIDMGWSDESHVRVITERMSRRRGEALHELHVCSLARAA
jgi:hypothetical protein